MTKADRGKGPGIEDLRSGEALEVLSRLWNRGGAIRKAVADEIEGYLRTEVDSEEVAGSVFGDLDLLRREDLWERSGTTAHGYDDPVDVAWEMVEEVVRPYLDEIDRYLKVGMKEEAFRCCLGVLMGLYDFKMESDSNFKEWAEDDPREAFRRVRSEWDRKCHDEALTRKLDRELPKRCPEWM